MRPVTAATPLVGNQPDDVQIGCCSVGTWKTAIISYTPALISVGTGVFGLSRFCDDGRAGTIALIVCSVAFGALSMLSSCCLCCIDKDTRVQHGLGLIAGAAGLAVGIKDAVYLGNC